MKAIFFIIMLFSLFGCKKFLDEKPNSSLVVPKTLQDLQALLDLPDVMNNGVSAGIAEGSADNYYLTDVNYQALASEDSRSIYLWKEEIFYNNFPNEWSNLYRVVNVANVVLENLDKIESSGRTTQGQQIKGAALFYRARSFLSLVSNWGLAYQLPASQTDLGVPLRLTSDFNEPSQRATVAQCFEQVVNDLRQAAQLLPEAVPHVLRPSKPAAFALLARTYLGMNKFEEALKAADSSMFYFNSLLNYNDLNVSATYPFLQYNKEVIFHSIIALPQHLNNSRAVIDSTLYNSYENRDLRKTAFFRTNGNNTYRFKGSYNGSVLLFDGIAADEVLLTRAECYARVGELAKAANDLNRLLRNRYQTGFYTDYSTSDQSTMINKILTERRKELLMRNVRWSDLKRLNKEIAFQTHVKRIINGQEYTLPPNDKRYALPLPAYVVEITGIPQNPR